MTRRNIFIVLGLATLTLSPAPSAAADSASRNVSIAGLDLSKPADQAKVQKQIRRAAWDICKSGTAYRTLTSELHARRCVDDAIASAQPQLERAVVLASARRRHTDSLALASRR